MPSNAPILREAIVVVIRRGDGHILIVERAAHDSYPGYWSPVTGSCETHDCYDLAATCRREALEEVGLNIRVIGKLWESTTAGAHFVLHWFLAEVRGSADVTPDSHEVSGYRWVLPDEFASVSPTFSDTSHFFASVWPRVYPSLKDR